MVGFSSGENTPKVSLRQSLKKYSNQVKKKILQIDRQTSITGLISQLAGKLSVSALLGAVELFYCQYILLISNPFSLVSCQI